MSDRGSIEVTSLLRDPALIIAERVLLYTYSSLTSVPTFSGVTTAPTASAAFEES